ncbi:MAG: transcriptional regulator, TetR family [Actinomycetia bacterium]|nr:transcriptional regulator, TetR family [Actinomycetes bacterium]
MDVRQRLLRAALASVAERGYAEAGLREIAASAGVTTGSLYHHFTGKDELVRAAVLEHADLVALALEAADPGRDTPADVRLRSLVGALGSDRDADRWTRDLGIVINIELPKVDGFQDVFDHMRPLLVSLIRRITADGIADGDLELPPGTTVDAFADVVLAGVVGLELMAARGSLNSPLQAALLLHVDAALALARPAPRSVTRRARPSHIRT